MVVNDNQFKSMCRVIGQPHLADDPKFAANSGRVENREELIAILKPVFETKTVDEWLSLIGDQFPCGPINNFEQVFAMPHVREREMLVQMEHPTIGALPLVGSPLKMGGTPVSYRLPPPLMGEHTKEVLKDILGFSDELVSDMLERGCVK